MTFPEWQKIAYDDLLLHVPEEVASLASHPVASIMVSTLRAFRQAMDKQADEHVLAVAHVIELAALTHLEQEMARLGSEAEDKARGVIALGLSMKTSFN